jgi:dTDP-4-amino-4,6-dideoxygalactose transaminase
MNNSQLKVTELTRDSLAIHGGTPRFAEPLHVGRPNIGDQARFASRMQQVLDSRWLTNNGPLVQELEARIANDLDVRHCVAMCNGTIALEIAIRALQLHGEVIIPSWTFIATAHALAWQGITPVFADIDPDTHNLSVDTVRPLISPRTTGIIGVHVWGRPAPVESLQTLCDEHGLSLLFDAAHAYRTSYRGRRIGGFGRCEVLSFHATKVFNTMEGGAVVTNDDELAAKMRLMRNFGFAGFDNVVHPGTNGKMIEASAAMGLTNLESLDDFIAANRRCYNHYATRIDALRGIDLMRYDPSEENNFHYIVASVSDTCATSRDRLVDVLTAENILARKYFWPGCHRMLPYRDKYDVDLPHTDAVARRNLVLPSGPTLSPDDIDQICDILALATVEAL